MSLLNFVIFTQCPIRLLEESMKLRLDAKQEFGMVFKNWIRFLSLGPNYGHNNYTKCYIVILSIIAVGFPGHALTLHLQHNYYAQLMMRHFHSSPAPPRGAQALSTWCL